MRTEIIYEDNDILVVYKPAGLATQTAKLGQPDVVSELKNYLKQSYLGVIHRLDQPVEGLLVFAKQKKAAADLTAQLQRQSDVGSLHKHYYAVVCGKPEVNRGRLVDYMYKSPENLAVIVEQSGDRETSHGATTMRSVATKEKVGNIAKEAVLEYCITGEREISDGKICRLSENLSERCEGHIALADIHILTGRFHQIRAQMAHAGLPLLGDSKYGTEKSKHLSKSLAVQMVALCANRLEFQHPVTKKRLRFEEHPRGKAFGFFS